MNIVGLLGFPGVALQVTDKFSPSVMFRLVIGTTEGGSVIIVEYKCNELFLINNTSFYFYLD